MTISVIIPTYNGANKLPSLLDALMKQTILPNEIIVAVDGSTDNTITVLETYKKSIPNLTILLSGNNGRSVIRNKGARQATGDLLIFFDDDMVPEPSCVKVHTEHHFKHISSILTGAQVDIADKSRNDVQLYKKFLSMKWIKKLNGGKPLGKENMFITAANFSIRKKLFQELEGFDERLKDAEDFDLAVRAFKKGIDLYFNYEAFAWHDDRINCKSYIKRQRQYSEAHQKLIDIHPWMQEEGFIKPVTKPSGWKNILFQVFLNKRWINAVDTNKLSWLPKFLRFKLYDLIITANGIFFPGKVKL
jgi:glycosyltransferase involved in cell wall biosynthesis